MDGNEEEETVLEASQVFLLMGKEYRISRSIRAQWFFQQFNSVLPQPKPEQELLASNEELEILSVLSNKPQISSSSTYLHLVPSTHITFIGRKYRFVFCLDISPSLAIVDIQTGSVITDEVFQKFKNCLTGLVAPFSVPGNKMILCPELYITVLAYTSILSPETPQILVQGVLVNDKNVDVILDMVSTKLARLETTLADTVASTHSAEQRNQRPESDAENFQSDPVTLLSPEAGPIAMLRSAILSLQLLPDNASAGAVVITDGVFALPDASAVDSLLAQLRGSTVCCTFLKVGSGFHSHCSIGYIPHCDLMQFIAMATSGAYLANTPPVVKDTIKEDSEDLPVMNLYHKSLLCWSFQRDYDLSKIESWIGDAIDLNEDDLAWPLSNSRSTFSYALSEWERNAMQPSMHKKQMETKLHTSITSVISVRLREGYSVQDVAITKGGKQLEVTLTLPWKQHVQIQYVAVSAWPLSRSNRVTHVAVTITAPYEFLHDVSYLSKESISSSYRAMVVKKFRQTMKNIQSTDEVLTHLQSFSSNPSYYTIPDSAKNGVPLFYLPPNSSNPVLSLQHERKSSKSQESQFAVFWKPVLTLDTTVWQRWLHCHRIGLVLEHDIPLPKNLHLPISNDHFHSIQCRMALSSLNSLLRSISSFVLLENHSYIKFIEGENTDSPPSSFCLIRVSSRAPCIVIRLAFLGGTPGHIRHSITKELRSNLRKVTAPIGPVSKLSSVQQDRKGKKSKKKGIQRLAEEKPCVLVLKKPLERILVRYERVPEDLFSPYPEGLMYSVYSTNTGLQYASRTNENHMKVLCHYMYHQRWVWSVQQDTPRHLNAEVVARVLNTLTKLRLQEKFNFASTNAGIITMSKELHMQDKTSPNNKPYSCIVQYVMFPPYCKPSADAVKDWVDGTQSPLPEVEEKLQMVTEVWIEPQFGVITSDEEAIQYLNGLQYYEVPQAIFEADYKYVSAFLTFERLWCMCDDQIISAPSTTGSVQSTTRPLPTPDRNWTVETIQYPFDTILLLPKSRQVEMVFSSLKETSVQDSSIQGEIPNEALFKLILEEMNRLHDREVMLSDKNCVDLVRHIVQRERGEVPVPFADLLNSTDTLQSSDNDKASDDTTPVIKWKCFVRSVQGLVGNCRLMVTFIPASLKYVKLFCKQIKYSHDNKPITGSKKDAVLMDKVKDVLSKRVLTPIMEDNEKRSLTPPIPDPSQDASPMDDKVTEQEMFKGSDLAADLLSPSNVDNTIKSAKELEPQDSKTSQDSESVNKCVKFKDDDNPTPTKENMSPLTPCTPNIECDGWLSYRVPIYCYDCPLYNLTHVEEKSEPGQPEHRPEEYRKREDIFQDFTSNSQIFVDPFSHEEMPHTSEGKTIGRFGTSKDLLLHCNAVHDIFFRCFVTSIFTSLQQGHQVNVRDVQSAVDTCEENFLEIDITEFIRTLCGHFPRDSDFPRSSEAFRGPSSLLLCQKTQSPIFQRENFQEFGTLAFLKSYLNDNCESALGLHQSVKDRFVSILGRYFKSMPSFGDLFFYCPQSAGVNRKSTSGSFEPEDDQEYVNEDDKSDAGSEVFGETVVLIQDDDLDQDQDPDYPLSDDSESDFGGSDGESDDLGDVEDDDKSLSTPLFLQLTCSLRDRSTIGGGTMTPVPIDSLPVCIGEIVRRMEEAEESIDLFRPSLQITIDLNCLTLSPVPDYSTLKSSVNHPTFSTSFSGSCGESSPVSLSPQEKFEFRRQDSKTVTSHDPEGLNGPDPLRSLPQQQRLAMNVSCEGIQWLLQDEIVSELRYTGPYNAHTLEKVERHVQRSEGHGHPLCIYRNISLQFVFGAEQSMELFMKEFEEMNALEYKLNKVEEYYYLTTLDEDKDCSDGEESKISDKHRDRSSKSSPGKSEDELQDDQENLSNVPQLDHKSLQAKRKENPDPSIELKAELSPEKSNVDNAVQSQENTSSEPDEKLSKGQETMQNILPQGKSSSIQSENLQNQKKKDMPSDISGVVDGSMPTDKTAPESSPQSQLSPLITSDTQSPEKDKGASGRPTPREDSKNNQESSMTSEQLSVVEKLTREQEQPETACSMDKEQETSCISEIGREPVPCVDYKTITKSPELEKELASEKDVDSDDKHKNTANERKQLSPKKESEGGAASEKDSVYHKTKQEELHNGEPNKEDRLDQDQLKDGQSHVGIANADNDEVNQNMTEEKVDIGGEPKTAFDQLNQDQVKDGGEGVQNEKVENFTRDEEHIDQESSNKDKLDEDKMKTEITAGEKSTNGGGEPETETKLDELSSLPDKVPLEGEVTTSVDVSIPLSVITTGIPFSSNDELSTPVPDDEFSYSVEAASTPMHSRDKESYFKGTNEKSLRLITSSHHAANLDLISPIDANQGQDSSSSSSKKTSPRETKQKLKFWLVLRLCNNFVDIFFHRRHSQDSLMSPTMAGGLIEVVVNAIHENCRAVNQRMLLQDLYDTKMCNSLLFPEADEDIWKHEDLRMSVSPVGVYISKSDGSGYIGRYVQGEFIFQPGHFQCSSKWYYHIIFHPRLQDPSGNSSNSLGRKIIRSVLDRFGVRNRRDMFVYKENSGRIFYFRLLESLCVCADQAQLADDVQFQDLDEQDDAVSNTSQKGSQLSLSQISLTREQENDDDLSEPRLKQSLTSLPRDKVEQSLAFHVYGVDEPGAEITVDLLEVLINRLDEATLDALTFMLSRNPNSKLNYADVTFIQPADEPPSDAIFIVIPPIDIGYLYPLFYYLKQNLLQIFTIPRYTDSNPRQHFRSTDSRQDEKSSAIFIYNRPQSSGAKCVACIAMRILDCDKEQIHFDVARIPSINVEHLNRNFYEDMTVVEALTDETVLDDNYIIEFSIWKRGSIGLDQLISQLKCITQHALCDLLMEYLLLPAPLSSIPEEYFVTQTFKLRSLSAPPTPSDMSPRTIKVGDKTEPAKQSVREDATTPEKDGRETVTRKISSDSIKSAPCHHRTPSTDSQGMDFKSFHDKQYTKGHRRTKSAEIRDKIFKNKTSPTTSKNTSEATLHNEENSSLPQRKIGFQVSADATIDETVAKEATDALDTVAKVGSSGSVAKDIEVSTEDAELALEVSCEKSMKKTEDDPKLYEELPTAEDHFPVETSRGHSRGDLHLQLEETYDTFSQQEILESQEFASTPTAQDNKYIPLLASAGEMASRGDLAQFSSSLRCPTTTPLVNIKKDESWQDVEIRRRKMKEKIKKRMKYESGQRGELHPNFHEPGRDLFSFAHGLGAPSVHSMEANVLSRFAVDFLLSELTTLLSNMCPEMTPRIYRQAPDHHHDNCDLDNSSDDSEDHRCCCPKYKPGREPLKAQSEEETTVDQKGRVYVRSPGSPCFFALIARDYNQWRSCLGMDNDENDEDSTNASRGFTGRQRFKAMESSVVSSKGSESSSLCSASSCTIPRQKLILLTFIDKKLILYTYNLASDLNQSLEDQIQRLIHWNNARCHLTNCLITQKMGLFHHLSFAKLNHGKKGKDENPYCLPSGDIDVFALISKTAPSERERGWSRSLSSAYLNVLDQVLRDVTPSRPLQRTPYLNHRDPVKRQGYHFREIRAVQIKTSTIKSALDDLYVKWQQAPPHHPVTDDKLEILKRSSRLVHYCACPLLFHPDWREKLSTDTRCIHDSFPISRSATVPSSEAREHNSNSSQSASDSAAGARSKHNAVSGPRNVSDAIKNPDAISGDKAKGTHSSVEKTLLEKEEEWHKNLRSAFIQQYVQYMQSLQFVVVQTRPHSPKPVKGSKRQARRNVNYKSKGEHDVGDGSKKQVLFRTNSDQNRFHQYLQKTSPGGIMLMELIFQGLYFYVRLYAIDCSRIPSGTATGQHQSRIFLEDCSHYKDYIHLLSFTYDFHLRQAQSFLSGRQMIFNKGYRVTDLLAEILRKHPEYPGFARNHICKGEIAVPCDPVISSLNVFKYIVKHSSQYDFSTIIVNKLNDMDTNFILLGTDQVLSPPRPKDCQLYSNLRDNAEYDITLVVTLKNSFEGSVIHLEYYILMTSRRELFPKLSLRLPGKSSFGSHGNSDNMERRGSSDVKSPRVRFARTVTDNSTNQTRYSPERKPRQTLDLQSSFHRSASSPHSLNKMVQEVTKSSIPQSQSDENIADAKKKLGTSPHSYSSGAISTMDGRSSREVALLNESSVRAHDHLIHVICRAQTHSKRDMLWFRLLAGGTGDEDKEAKKRRKSEFRRPLPDLAENWSTGIEVEELYQEIGNEGTTSKELSADELKLLLSIVVCKSLRGFDKNLEALLSMNVNWYQGLLRVLIAKFPTLYRSFSSINDEGDVHYLVILNPKELDVFLLVVVDMKENKTDIQVVFREESKADLTVDVLIDENSIKDHIYSVLNAACFHLWATLLPS